MSIKGLTETQMRMLEAMDDGRLPAEEAVIAKLRRKGLVARAALGERRYYLTDDGRALLAARRPEGSLGREMA